MSQPQPAYQHYLRRYFYSGWAFLIPYLFAYLLYYVTKWPVNPVGVRVSIAHATVSPSHALPLSNASFFPCLLHVYWAFHAIHVVLAGFALWSWFAERRAAASLRANPVSPAGPSLVDAPLSQPQSAHEVRPYTEPVGPFESPAPSVDSGPHTRCDPTQSDEVRAQGAPPTRLPVSPSFASPASPISQFFNLPPPAFPPALVSQFSNFPLSRFLPVFPWLLLALIFYIPGVYLEWPSDPWEHLRRINEWRVLDTVGAHSSWVKSAYFIPYSLLSWCIGLRQLFWLDFYYTGICLLLCWQYYRFSRACGLGERASMVFVIIQALLFGNNIFSFYRYYGISSSIYAQLGAVALTRIVLEFAAQGTKLEKIRRPVREKDAERPKDTSAPPHLESLLILSSSTSPLLPIFPSSKPRPSFWHLPSLALLLSSSLALFILTAFNHPQGLGIAGLGIAAVIVWRLIEWKRSALWWLIGGTLIVNALFLWFYPRPAIIETYRAQGWLNAWYGFNILDLSSPAGDRMLQIVSAFGLVNLTAGLFLFRRNQVVGWLVVTPPLLLIAPSIAVPFVQAIARRGDVSDILTFQRLLFAIPTGLAFVGLGEHLLHRPRSRNIGCNPQYKTAPMIAIACCIVAVLTTVSSSSPAYNRTWHASLALPNDLMLRDVVSQFEAVIFDQRHTTKTKIITNQAGTALLAYDSNLIGTSRSRKIGLPPQDSISATLEFLGVETTNNIPQLPSPTKANEGHGLGMGLNLVADPFACDPNAWIALGRHPAEFAIAISDLPSVTTALQNPVGIAAFAFTSSAIPIAGSKSYQLEMSAKQVDDNKANVYLAVIWYDANGKLLKSDTVRPEGAGKPRGWDNGPYSYFGLVSEPAPKMWTTYATSFGLHESASIPVNARFVRVGALLNYNATPLAQVQLTDVRLVEKSTPEIDFALPKATSSYTPNSQAALLSTHWPSQQSIVDRGGTKEILSAANRP